MDKTFSFYIDGTKGISATVASHGTLSKNEVALGF
jgi:hypothetical protein